MNFFKWLGCAIAGTAALGSFYTYNGDNKNILCMSLAVQHSPYEYVYAYPPKTWMDVVWRDDYYALSSDGTIATFNGKFTYMCSDTSCVVSSSDKIFYRVLGNHVVPWTCSYSIYNEEVLSSRIWRTIRYIIL